MLLGKDKKRFVRGFTLVELMVSIAILAIISVTVTTDIAKTGQQEELFSSARIMVATLRGLQSRALSATSVLTCNNGTINLVCDVDDTICGVESCSTKLVPFAVGATLQTSESMVTKFAEVDVALEDRREDASGCESLGEQRLAERKSGSDAVTISSLRADSVSISVATVTFDRQDAAMRINACGTPSGAPPCGATEPTTLEITLTHSKLGRSETIRLNALTGKIAIE
jgi:prepilin-type N-terminal cleavage/methylation domain-containing protein